MKAISTSDHEIVDGIRTCTALFKVGKFGRNRNLYCYRLPREAWRLTGSGKIVKGIK